MIGEKENGIQVIASSNDWTGEFHDSTCKTLWVRSISI